MQQRVEGAKPRESDSHGRFCFMWWLPCSLVGVCYFVLTLEALHLSETSVPNLKGTCRSTAHVSILIVSGGSGT
jgi:hypothetical protein